MGEYQEDSDFDELLAGDDSEDEDQEEEAKGNLLSMDDLTVNAPEDDNEKTRSKPDLLEQILLENLNDVNIDEYEEDEDKENDMKTEDTEEALKQRLNEVEENRKKHEELLQSTNPPGINLFRSKRNPDQNSFQYFTLETLSLEDDFGYSRREKLLSHGFSVPTIEEIFSDRFELVRHLFPEAHSVLICDQADFQSVMNFLFYSISVCPERSLSELMTKAFFDLRKNYGFKWNLNLSHVLTVLLNYGADEAAVFNKRFYQKHLEKHIEAVRRSGQRVDNEYQMPTLPEFVQRRREGAGSESVEEEVSQGNFRFCLVKFIELLMDFSAGQPSHLEFRVKDNWSDQIILIYTLLIVGTDKRLINDSLVRDAIRTGIHYHLDSFSSSQWHWGPERKDRPRTMQGAKDFNYSNVCKSLIILLNEFFPKELCPDTVNWEVVQEHSSKVSFRLNNISDHHLNMMSRINLIPPSYRGNQVKKFLAFMYIQTIAETVFVTPTHVDVFDIVNIPELNHKIATGIRLIVTAKNHDVIKTLVQLYDTVIGHEPDIDFTDEKIEAIQNINKNVLLWIEKKLPNNNRTFSLDDPKNKKAFELSNFLLIIKMRWTSNCKKN